MLDAFKIEPPLLAVPPLSLIITLAVPLLFSVVVLLLLSFVLVQALRIKSERAQWAKYPSYDEIPASSLRQMASKKTLADLSGNVDVAVVGSGIGALSSAAMLAKAGYKVVVFEKHYTVGGSSQTFTHEGFEFDVGVHYVGGGRDMPKMFDYLTDGKLKWSKVSSTYDVCYNAETGQRIEFTDDPKVNRKNLIATIDGLDEEALDRYDAACLRARRASWVMIALKILPPFLLNLIWPLLATPIFNRFALKPAKTVIENECGLTPEAVGALTYHYGDVGTTPGRIPMFLHAALDNHYKRGAYFPTGGSASIAKTLVASITRRGGHVFAACPVESILTERTTSPFGFFGGYRAVGVRVHGVDVRVRRAVISDAGFRNTFGSVCAAEGEVAGDKAPLIDAEASAAQRALLYEDGREAAVPSPSYVSLYVGLDGTDEEIGIPAGNVWHLRSWDHDGNMERMNASEEYYEEGEDPPFLFISNESAKDPEYAKNHPGRATLEVMAPAKYDWFTAWRDEAIKHRGADYQALKDRIGKPLLEALCKHFPQIRGHVVFTEVATPLTVDHYLGRQRGEVYNLDHTVGRFGSSSVQRGLHPQTTVKDLYLAGQDALCVSVMACTISGMIAAGRISFLAMLHALPILLPGFGV